jgi:hypothetical protein
MERSLPIKFGMYQIVTFLLREKSHLHFASENVYNERAYLRIKKGDALMNILTLNLLFMTTVYWVAARIYVLPRLNTLEPRSILLPILLLHGSRHLGMMFLAPGAVYPGIAPEFAYPAAFGDLLTALLALIAIWAVMSQFKSAHYLLWVFNVVGTIDLLNAIVLATIYNAAGFMGAAYWIPAFWVPALLVTHYIVFLILLRPRDKRAALLSV